MPGYISQDILDEIRSRADIVEIIREYLPLKKSGRNFKALCPFHSEKTPSFMVSPSKQIYHCFGCGEGGNVFNFVMKHEHLEFPEAVRKIAEKVGVKIPEKTYKDKNKQSLYNKLYEINEFAVKFYNYVLNNFNEAQRAKIYLKKRNFTQGTVDKFQLGYAPDEWRSLYDKLRKKGYEPELIEKAGLITKKKDSNYFDLFRDRVIFPVFSAYDKIIGFGARTLKKDKLPKYINTPETPIFSKRKNLYGLNLAKQHISKNDLAIIVEGFTDCIRAHENKIQETVASLGTSLTIEQIRTLKRYTKNIVLVYDADQAGQLASLRGLDLLVEEDMTPKIAVLPEGFDPDKYIEEAGAEKFKQVIEKALNLFDYKINLLCSKYDIKKPEDKVKITAEFLPTLSKINNAVLKSSYTKKLADKLNVKEEDVVSELKKHQKVDYRDYDAEVEEKEEIDIDMAEKIIITLMLENNELIPKVKEKLKPDDFEHYYTKKIISEIFKIAENNKEVNPARLIDAFDDEIIIQLVCSLSLKIPEIEKIEKNLTDCVKRIRERNIKKKLKQLQMEIKMAQEKNIDSKVNELTSEFTNLLNKQKQLSITGK
jgi:DNA primase